MGVREWSVHFTQYCQYICIWVCANGQYTSLSIVNIYVYGGVRMVSTLHSVLSIYIYGGVRMVSTLHSALSIYIYGCARTVSSLCLLLSVCLDVPVEFRHEHAGQTGHDVSGRTVHRHGPQVTATVLVSVLNLVTTGLVSILHLVVTVLVSILHIVTTGQYPAHSDHWSVSCT